jgi:hypothetical protein
MEPKTEEKLEKYQVQQNRMIEDEGKSYFDGDIVELPLERGKFHVSHGNLAPYSEPTKAVPEKSLTNRAIAASPSKESKTEVK